MRKLFITALAFGAAYIALEYLESPGTAIQPTPITNSVQANDTLTRALREQRSDVQVLGSGVVSRILSDDNDGSRHQRFILRLASGQTVLVAHNIDLAPRIGSLQVGDTVGFYGEYEWNDRGGVIHWTHHDPQGRHPDGWLEHRGQRYR